jgi:acyl-CoA thioester hydrolase
MSEAYRSWHPVQIRFRDLDPLAHVNNTVYFIYLEESRFHYFSQLTPWLKQWPSSEEHQQPEEEAATQLNDDTSPNPRIRTGPRGQHYGTLVKEVNCTFQLPLIHSDQAEAGTRVVHIGRSSFIMEHQIRDQKEHKRVYATGRSVLVWCNYYTGRSHPLPASLRYAIEQMEQRSFVQPEGGKS